MQVYEFRDFRRMSGYMLEKIQDRATLLLTFNILEGDQVSPFSSVIRLTWRRLLRWSADVCSELCNSFISVKCPRNCVMAVL